MDSVLRVLAYEKSGPSLLIRSAELDAAIAERFPDTPEAAEFEPRVPGV
jgi:hypothetical protein